MFFRNLKITIVLMAVAISCSFSSVYGANTPLENSTSNSKLVVDSATEYLSDWLKDKYEKFSIRHVGKIELRSKEKIVIQVPELRYIKAEKRMSVWVDIYSKGRRIRSIPVWFAVEAYQNVYVATKNIGLRKNLFVNDLKVELRDITTTSDSVIHKEKIIGMQLKRPILKGQMLTWESLEKVPAVSVNQKIKVVLKDENLHLVTTGVAANSGNIGEIIRVFPNSNQRENFIAKVIAKGVVLVSER